MNFKLLTSSLMVFTMVFTLSNAQSLNASIVDDDVVFQEADGLVAVEAEYFYKQTKSDIRQWYITAKDLTAHIGRDEDGPHCKDAGNNAYIEILPDTRVTHGDILTSGENFSNEAGKMGILHYKVKIDNPGRYYVWARAYSGGGEDNGLHVGMNGEWPETGQRLQWCEGKNSWRWESKQRTEKVHCGEPFLIYLDIKKTGIQEITFSMREDGFEFDRFLLTRDKAYVPQGVGPDVTLASGSLPKAFPVVTKDPAVKPSFLYTVEHSTQGVNLLRATRFPVEGTNFYLDKSWLAINPDEHKNATTSMSYTANDGTFDVLFLGVGENDGGSSYTLSIDETQLGVFKNPLSVSSFEEGVKYMHLVENVEIKKGEKITVISEVGSKDGQEWSRGRWSGLALLPQGKGKEALKALEDVGTAQNVGGAVAGAASLTNVLPQISGELKKWHKLTLTFEGPEVSEEEEYSPFMNYRFNVIFTHKSTGKTYTVPGYFAADGNAGETSATSGNKWRVHFAPDETGSWAYHVDFRKGTWVAVSERSNAGTSAGFMDTSSGTFDIAATDKSGKDLRAKGMLQYDGTRYLKFAETGLPMLKVGPDAPENFLAYVDFDGTFHKDGHKDDLVKTWEAHNQHWNEGDPTWQGGKGKAMIGAVNYLSSKGMNVFSFLTNNIAGDDQNVFPYVDYDRYDRFDCSKLDQWEVVFDHAEKLGMFLHFKTLEAENQGLLDNGAIGAHSKLYYRELMARFGHHLAMNWNIGEEIGDWVPNPPTPPLFTAQRLAAAQYFFDHDPYSHHVVIHNGTPFHDVLGPNSKYSGISLQTNRADFGNVHAATLKWLKLSKEAGKQWAVAVDEPGDAQHSLLPDAENPEHNNARINGLWGAFMAGSWGTEWYFGYKHAHSDLTCQDFASRDLWWDQCKYVLDFFEGNQLPFWETENQDELVSEGDYCLAKSGELYIVFLKKGSGTLNLADVEGSFEVKWFDPRNGGELQKGTHKKAKGGKIVDLQGAPSETKKDWVVLLEKI